MRYKRLKLSVCVLSLFGVQALQAQESFTATGANASSNNGSVSYSIGQVTYQTHMGANGSIAEGVQQPYEITVISAIKETSGINLSVTAYPNPTTDYFVLNCNGFEISNLSYQLFDMTGKLLQHKDITNNQTDIIMNNLIPATYFVKVIQHNIEVKSFKIIKK